LHFVENRWVVLGLELQSDACEAYRCSDSSREFSTDPEMSLILILEAKRLVCSVESTVTPVNPTGTLNGRDPLECMNGEVVATSIDCVSGKPPVSEQTTRLYLLIFPDHEERMFVE